MELKKCRTCGERKALDNFGPLNHQGGRLRTECNSCRSKRQKRHRETDKGRFVSTRNGASKRDIDFLIPFDEFVRITSLPCSYCGVPGPSGLDRKDSTRDYSLDNVVPCCHNCNRSKGATKSCERYLLEQKKEKDMIDEFPFLDELTSDKLKAWLHAQKSHELSQAYKYESCGNLSMAERCRYKASTFENILIHIKYHMQDNQQ